MSDINIPGDPFKHLDFFWFFISFAWFGCHFVVLLDCLGSHFDVILAPLEPPGGPPGSKYLPRPSLDPAKSHQVSFLDPPRADLIPAWANLEPTWAWGCPQVGSSRPHVGSCWLKLASCWLKLASCWSQVGLRANFGGKLELLDPEKTYNNQWFFNIFQIASCML